MKSEKQWQESRISHTLSPFRNCLEYFKLCVNFQAKVNARKELQVEFKKIKDDFT